MRFPHKLLMLGGALALGWAALLIMLVPRLLNEQNQVQRERDGVDGVVVLGDFMDAVQDHRRAIRLHSKGDAKAAADLPDIEATAGSIATHMDTWIQGPGAKMDLAPEWQSIREQWRQLAAEGANGDPAETIDQHNDLIQRATVLINQISDTSGLNLDPEPSSTYLVDALSQIPPIGAELTIVRGSGWGALIDGQLDDATRTSLIRRSTLLQNIMERISADMEKATAQEPTMQESASAARASSQAVDDLLAALDQHILTTPILSENAPAFRRLGDEAWHKLGRLRQTAAAQLTYELSRRADGVRHQARFTLSICLIAALLTTLIFLGFVESLNRSLDTISRGARQLARGDFPNRIVIAARDEMSDIATELEAVSHAFKAMTDGLQHALALQSAIVDSSNLGIIVTDQSGLIVGFNRAAQQMLGYEEQEVIGRKRLDFMHDPGELARHARTLSEQLGYAVLPGFEALVAKARTQPDRVDEQEWTYIRRDGGHVPVLLPVTAMRNLDSTITGFLAVAHDISERKQKDLAIARSLKEKEMLLKEVYHRVKNNLQVVTSLFDLQLRTLPDGPATTALRDGASRVGAMALIHEKLYQSGTLSSISLQNYIEEFSERLALASSTRERRINLITHVEAIEVSMDTAVPLGLWINEVVSNSLKHGFPDSRPGSIRITLERDGESAACITVADDGVGIAPPDGQPKRKSLGMKLVAALSDQLGGRYTVESAQGVTTQLRFPLPPI